jgi:hypothetical protein
MAQDIVFLQVSGVNTFDGGVFVFEGLLPDVFVAQAGFCPV